MSAFLMRIMTPEKIFFEGSVERLVLRTAEGDLGVLAKHEKFVACLPAGPLRMIAEDGKTRLAAISGGMLKISPEQTVILANAVEWAEDIDIDWAKRSEEDARRQRAQSKNPHDLARADLKLARALNRLRVSSMTE